MGLGEKGRAFIKLKRKLRFSLFQFPNLVPPINMSLGHDMKDQLHESGSQEKRHKEMRL